LDTIEKISVRRAKFAKSGLVDFCNYIPEECRGAIAEIGSYVGDSTEIFAQYFEKVYSIDPFLNGYDDNDDSSHKYDMRIVEAQFDELCKQYPNIRKIKMKSENAVMLFHDNTVPVVYIDALHTYDGVNDDIWRWYPKIRKGGYLAGHDYQGRFPGVIEAVHKFRKPDAIFRDTSWVIKIG